MDCILILSIKIIKRQCAPHGTVIYWIGSIAFIMYFNSVTLVAFIGYLDDVDIFVWSSNMYVLAQDISVLMQCACHSIPMLCPSQMLVFIIAAYSWLAEKFFLSNKLTTTFWINFSDKIAVKEFYNVIFQWKFRKIINILPKLN